MDTKKLNQAIQTLKPQEQGLSTHKNISRRQELLLRLSDKPDSITKQENGANILDLPDEQIVEVNALELIEGTPLDEGSFLAAKIILEQNYGREYSDAKFRNLFDLMLGGNWTKERFERTLVWLRKHKPFPACTEADWFTHSIKVFNYGWLLERQVKDGWRKGDYDRYEL